MKKYSGAIFLVVTMVAASMGLMLSPTSAALSRAYKAGWNEVAYSHGYSNIGSNDCPSLYASSGAKWNITQWLHGCNDANAASYQSARLGDRGVIATKP